MPSQARGAGEESGEGCAGPVLSEEPKADVVPYANRSGDSRGGGMGATIYRGRNSSNAGYLKRFEIIA
jgi:hypothetical protein